MKMNMKNKSFKNFEWWRESGGVEAET